MALDFLFDTNDIPRRRRGVLLSMWVRYYIVAQPPGRGHYVCVYREDENDSVTPV